jgi:hypothetical protein
MEEKKGSLKCRGMNRLNDVLNFQAVVVGKEVEAG